MHQYEFNNFNGFDLYILKKELEINCLFNLIFVPIDLHIMHKAILLFL